MLIIAKVTVSHQRIRSAGRRARCLGKTRKTRADDLDGARRAVEDEPGRRVSRRDGLKTRFFVQRALLDVLVSLGPK